MSARVFYSLVKNMFRGFFALYNRLDVRGLDNVAPGATVIVAANHSSYLDPPLIGSVFPGRLRYLAKESLFRVPLLGFFIRVLGAIPVTREDSQRAGAVMKLLLARLKNSESILLFPEGARSLDGKLQALEGGVAFLSVKTGVPVMPMYVQGALRAWPRGSLFPRPRKLRLFISPPIHPDLNIANEHERRGALMKVLDGELRAMESEAGELCI
jgi:1-acyl-sn-glycerol-3-phosphate acyltransferase